MHLCFTNFKVCITQTISKGKQRIVEIAICTSLHRVILKVRQLRVILIECDRQFTTWVTITKQHISNSCTSLLTSIPCLNNGVTSLCLRSKSNSRTRTIHKYYLLSSLFQCLQEITLNLRQLNAGTVATLESFYLHRHLLSLESSRDTTAENNLTDTLQLGNNLLIVDRQFLGDINFQIGIPVLNKLETYLDIISLSFLSLNGSTRRCCTPCMLYHFLLAVYIEFKVPASFYINDILTRLFRSEYCFILCREVFNLYARSKVVHTRCSNSKWCGVILCGYWFSVHSSIIPECSLQTFLTTYSTLGSQLAVHHLIVSQVTAFGIE